MPLFKQERTVTIYVEADSMWDLMFGTTVDKWDQTKEPKFTILHWSENVKLAEKIPEEEFKEVKNTFKESMKCPSGDKLTT